MDRVRFLEGPATLSERAQKVFQLAHQEAHRLHHPAVGTEHLLLGLAKEGLSPAAHFLNQLGFDLGWIRVQVERVHPPGLSRRLRPAALPYTPDLAAFLESVVHAAEFCGVRPVMPEHLLAALIATERPVVGILRQRWLSLWLLRRKLRKAGPIS